MGCARGRVPETFAGFLMECEDAADIYSSICRKGQKHEAFADR